MRQVLSYGGGLDSFAMLLDAIDRAELPEVVAFVDVSDGRDPGEWPGTMRHMAEVVAPLCARAGLEFVRIDAAGGYPVRDAPSLFAWMHARGQIPVAGPNRICTRVAKVERFERWLTDRFPREEVSVWIGFEAGEEARASKDPNAGSKPSKQRRDPNAARRVNRFPLIEHGLCRCRCAELVRRHGLPVPRKSACVFCPYGSLRDWQTFARELPEAFARVVDLEARKPPTSAGHKLSIMGYKTARNAGEVVGVRAPPLPEYIKGRPQARRRPCTVCGADKLFGEPPAPRAAAEPAERQLGLGLGPAATPPTRPAKPRAARPAPPGAPATAAHSAPHGPAQAALPLGGSPA